MAARTIELVSVGLLFAGAVAFVLFGEVDGEGLQRLRATLKAVGFLPVSLLLVISPVLRNRDVPDVLRLVAEAHPVERIGIMLIIATAVILIEWRSPGLVEIVVILVGCCCAVGVWSFLGEALFGSAAASEQRKRRREKRQKKLERRGRAERWPQTRAKE